MSNDHELQLCRTCRYWTRLPLIQSLGACALAQAYLVLEATPEGVAQTLSMYWRDAWATSPVIYPTVPTHDGCTLFYAGCEHGYEPRTI